MFEENFFENYTPIYANFDHIDAMSNEEAAEALVEIVSGLFDKALREAKEEFEFEFALTPEILLNPTSHRLRRCGPYNTKEYLKKIALAEEFDCVVTNLTRGPRENGKKLNWPYAFAVRGLPFITYSDEDDATEVREIIVLRNYSLIDARGSMICGRDVRVNTCDFVSGIDISDAIHCGRLASQQTVHLRGTIDEIHRDLRMIYLDRSLNFMRK